MERCLNSHQNELPINEGEAEKAKVTGEVETETEEELPQIIWITGGPGSSKRYSRFPGFSIPKCSKNPVFLNWQYFNYRILIFVWQSI